MTIGSDTLDGAAVAVAADGNSLTFVTPGGPAGPVDVMVTTPGGSSTPPLSFVYRAAPTSSTLTPDEGPLAANTAVVLSGADFVVGGSTVHVVFADATTADIPAGDVTVDGDGTTATFAMPVGPAVGAAQVTLSTSGGRPRR